MRQKPIDARWVHRFLYKWQWAYQASNTKGAYLPDDCEEMQETRQAHRMKQCAKPSKLRRSAARSEFVVGGRVGVTAVTSTWADGTMGPLGVCVASGSLPLAWIQQMNSDYRGFVYIFESGTETHFMNAETTMLYLTELIGPVPWPSLRGI